MQQLALRLAALDPEAGAALRVVAYFDELAACGAGLTAAVRGAALLTGSAASLDDPRRRLRVRVDSDGVSSPLSTGTSPSGTAPDPGWLSAVVDDVEGGAVLRLERPGPARVVDAVVLERAASFLHAVLTRTRPLHGEPAESDEAAVEVLLDGTCGPSQRRRAAQVLGLDMRRAYRVVVTCGASPRLIGSRDDLPAGGRVGVGPPVTPEHLPGSWADARRALRLAADGTPEEPGPRVVVAEQVPSLLLLTDAVGAETPRSVDVVALDQLAVTVPWALVTLEALVACSSRRTAAASLGIHHSSLSERVHALERQLHWSLDEPAGLLRLTMALVVRRLHRHLT